MPSELFLQRASGTETPCLPAILTLLRRVLLPKIWGTERVAVVSIGKPLLTGLRGRTR